MNRVRTGLLGAVLVLATMTASLAAKGATVRLTVAGPGLPYPVELASPNAITANVFRGNFVGTRVSEPDGTLPRYTVSFFVETPRNPVRMMYVVYYVRNPQTGQGLIYLPGPGDEWYRLNVRTILRGHEGEWHDADDAWSRAIAAALPHS
jgi:hypothetical protein